MYSHCPVIYCATSDVWVDEPTQNGVIIYSVITPILTICGIFGNILCLLIITKKEFTSSIYTYLSVLAVTDLVASVFLLISGLCRGILWWAPGWREYEAIIAIPFGGTFTCWAVTAIVAVTFDRIVYLWTPMRTSRPAFCQPKVARIMMFGGLCISILFNVPYCFMYTWDVGGELQMTDFVKSEFYQIHNWTKLIVFAILPAILLMVGNAFLIRSLKRLYNMKEECMRRCNKIKSTSRDQIWVTGALVAMVFLFLIGEIPTHLVSRTSAVTLLFWGDDKKADESKVLELFRQIATLLNGLNLALNFFIYYMFCGNFRRSLHDSFNCISMRKKKAKQQEMLRLTQVNVFIVDTSSRSKCGEKSGIHISQFHTKIMQLLEENKLAANIVTSSKIY